jgi:hypothetical protein
VEQINAKDLPPECKEILISPGRDIVSLIYEINSRNNNSRTTRLMIQPFVKQLKIFVMQMVFVKPEDACTPIAGVEITGGVHVNLVASLETMY